MEKQEFHKRAKGLPSIRLPDKLSINPSNHAKREAENDEHGSFDIPKEIKFDFGDNPVVVFEDYAGERWIDGNLFKIEYHNDGEKHFRLGIEIEYDDERQVTFIVKRNNGVLITTWADPLEKALEWPDPNPEEYNHPSELIA